MEGLEGEREELGTEEKKKGNRRQFKDRVDKTGKRGKRKEKRKDYQKKDGMINLFQRVTVSQ